eukprot:gnl/MRDRNA2_/MRDRNA2_70253_c0_seq1.p1 gnl/MRDRNA2_/MRDRNA2_70253_c0~~gnl/MRDRNA2_/MRDRNA2_70253_c0_seq1.p1  ORF type:complete len:679 (-),score=109.89 gnl/MRDRNA2_/MRDRNA2_70253_c0_seq1:18-1760(-)
MVADDESTREISLFMVEEAESSGPCGFVTRGWFQLLGGCVIIVNVVILAQQHIHQELEHNYAIWVTNQFILSFYVLEVVAKLAHFGVQFFTHPVDRLWNWMDFIIVLAGVIDEWVMPTADVDVPSSGSNMVQASRVIRILRILRIFRLLRIMKLAKLVKDADFSWTEATWFQSLVGVVIVSNAIVMGLETDLHSEVWWWVEQFFLTFYLFEIIVRVKRQGSGFLYDEDERWWNFFDVSIIASAVADQWALPLLFPSIFAAGESGPGSPKIGQIMNVMRLVRLLRILRLVRLIRTIRPLFVLAQGIIRAMQSMFWVLVLTVVALYAFAIITTRMIGHAMMVRDPNDLPEVSRHMFKTVPDSMFALFGIMNGQNWSNIMPLLDMIPWTKPVFVVFTIYASWALLSVMTGVVSDNMLSAREVDVHMQDELAHEKERKKTMAILDDIFTMSCEGASNGNRSGGMSRKEYRKVVADPNNKRKIDKLSTVSQADLLRMYDMIDLDQSGKVEYDEFITGFNWLNESVTGKSLLKMECEFRHKVKLAENRLDKHLDRIGKRVDDLAVRNAARYNEIYTYLQEKTGKMK